MRRATSRAGLRVAGAVPPAADPASRSRAAAGRDVTLRGFSPREILLAAAARAVLAAFREELEARRLPAAATATLRLLETALESYQLDPSDPSPRPGKRAARK
jgi:hypothetical protein